MNWIFFEQYDSFIAFLFKDQWFAKERSTGMGVEGWGSFHLLLYNNTKNHKD